MKGKAIGRIEFDENDMVHEVEEAEEVDDEDMTPRCLACGISNVGIMEDAFVMIRGMWMTSREYDVPVFVLDPDTKIKVIQLPNDQFGIFVDYHGPTKHAHKDCIEQVVEEQFDDDDGNF